MQINHSFPQDLLPFLDMAELTDCSSHSTATVWRLSTGYYLKIDQAGQLAQEYQMCRWFFQQKLGVEPILYLTRDKDYLLTRTGQGQPAHHYLDRPTEVVKALAIALRQLHNQTPSNIPAPNRLNDYLTYAKKQADAGVFYEQALLPRFGIKNREEALDILNTKSHLLKADTPIHGDYCLPNILLTNQLELTELIDLGLAGLSDRHVDLFWAIWSLNYNLGTDQYSSLFLDSYGRDVVDEDRLVVVAAIECFG